MFTRVGRVRRIAIGMHAYATTGGHRITRISISKIHNYYENRTLNLT